MTRTQCIVITAAILHERNRPDFPLPRCLREAELLLDAAEKRESIHEAACKRDFPAGVQEESAEEMEGLE